jgi:hypothetical protein
MAAALLLASSAAHADFHLSPGGGFFAQTGDITNAFSSTGLTYGGELTYLTPAFEGGVFYQRYNMSGKTAFGDDHAYFWGAVIRVPWGNTDFFSDFRGGPTKQALADDDAFGFGAGVGYRYALNDIFGVQPRIGVNYLPVQQAGDNQLGRALFDFTLMVTISTDGIFPKPKSDNPFEY